LDVGNYKGISFADIDGFLHTNSLLQSISTD